MPQVHLSCENKGKMSACFVETTSCEVTMATIPSPNSGAVTPRTSLVLISEATDGVASTVPQGTHEVPNRQGRTRAPSGANHLRSKEADKASQCASLPSSLSTKLALHNKAKDHP